MHGLAERNMNPMASEFQLHHSPISYDFGQATLVSLGLCSPLVVPSGKEPATNAEDEETQVQSLG